MWHLGSWLRLWLKPHAVRDIENVLLSRKYFSLILGGNQYLRPIAFLLCQILTGRKCLAIFFLPRQQMGKCYLKWLNNTHLSAVWSLEALDRKSSQRGAPICDLEKKKILEYNQSTWRVFHNIFKDENVFPHRQFHGLQRSSSFYESPHP